MIPNFNYKQLEESYLFNRYTYSVSEYSKNHPEKDIIRMGIGDVTRPLCAAVVEAMKQAGGRYGKGGNLSWLRPGTGI